MTFDKNDCFIETAKRITSSLDLETALWRCLQYLETVIPLTGISLALFERNFAEDLDNLLLTPPEHGFVSLNTATKWEESMLTGNGTLGALVIGHPANERIILSHEKLFMPEYLPTKAPDLASNLETFRQMVLEGKGEEASELAVKLGEEVGIEGMIWTNPLIPACQIEIETMDQGEILNYARSVDYETGEAITVWQTDQGTFKRSIFTSRLDNVTVLKVSSVSGSPLHMRMRLAQLSGGEAEPVEDEEEESAPEELIEKVSTNLDAGGRLTYQTQFRKKWEGSLKGYVKNSIYSSLILVS